MHTACHAKMGPLQSSQGCYFCSAELTLFFVLKEIVFLFFNSLIYATHGQAKGPLKAHHHQFPLSCSYSTVEGEGVEEALPGCQLTSRSDILVFQCSMRYY